MHLESTRDQCVQIPAAELSVDFAAFETIHTESSYKFTPKTLRALLDDAGFKIEQTWTDPRQWSALTLRACIKACLRRKPEHSSRLSQLKWS